MAECACGCGATTTVHKGKARRFVHGHAMRVYRDRVAQGLKQWRATPEGRASVALHGQRAAERLRSPAMREAVSRAHTGRQIAKDVAATRPTVRDLAWVAGFLEGEGSFFAQQGRFPQVSATQVQREPLHRLSALLGGKVYERPPRSPTQQSTGWWRVSGARARGVALTLYGMMSPRRQAQIRAMLGAPRGH